MIGMEIRLPERIQTTFTSYSNELHSLKV